MPVTPPLALSSIGSPMTEHDAAARQGRRHSLIVVLTGRLAPDRLSAARHVGAHLPKGCRQIEFRAVFARNYELYHAVVVAAMRHDPRPCPERGPAHTGDRGPNEQVPYHFAATHGM